jgi:NADPH:quinone reductase-like Zn-dependent oxidoreductase
MRVYRFPTTGSLERLILAEEPALYPGPGEVRVRMRAASLNYQDLIAPGIQGPFLLGGGFWVARPRLRAARRRPSQQSN